MADQVVVVVFVGGGELVIGGTEDTMVDVGVGENMVDAGAVWSPSPWSMLWSMLWLMPLP